MQTKTYVVQRVHHISLVEWDNFLSPCARSLMSCQIGPSSQSFANLRSYGIKYDFLGTYKLAYNIRSAIAALFSAIFNWLVLWNRRWRHIHKVVFCCFIFRGIPKCIWWKFVGISYHVYYVVEVPRSESELVKARMTEWWFRKKIFFFCCVYSVFYVR